MEIRFVANKDIKSKELENVIALKNEYWKYPFSSHIKWIENNLLLDDVHMLMYGNTELLAYLNIVHININFDDTVVQALGIGNVCVQRKLEHTGLGKKILTILNDYISKNNDIGILLCKPSLVGFYEKCNWNLIHPMRISIAGKDYDNCVMVYTTNNELLTTLNKITEIKIPKNF